MAEQILDPETVENKDSVVTVQEYAKVKGTWKNREYKESCSLE